MCSSDLLAMLKALERAHPIETLGAVTDGALLPELQRAVWGVHVAEPLRDYLVRLAGALRVHPDLALGASPRASLALFRAAQASAATDGRDFVIPDDLKGLAGPVLRHRLLVRPESALRGRTAAGVLAAVLGEVEVPVI